MEAALARLTLDQLNLRLTEALDAVHALQTGVRTIDVRFGERVIRYQESDLPRLEAYISQLTAAIDIKQTGRPSRRPMYFTGAS